MLRSENTWTGPDFEAILDNLTTKWCKCCRFKTHLQCSGFHTQHEQNLTCLFCFFVCFSCLFYFSSVGFSTRPTCSASMWGLQRNWRCSEAWMGLFCLFVLSNKNPVENIWWGFFAQFILNSINFTCPWGWMCLKCHNSQFGLKLFSKAAELQLNTARLSG